MNDVKEDEKEHLLLNFSEKQSKSWYWPFEQSFFSMELLFELAIIGVISAFTWYSGEQTSLLFLSFSTDSIFSAVGFLRLYVNQMDLTESQTITQLRSLYQATFLDRYLYYFSMCSLFNLLLIIFWGNFRSFFYHSFIITLCPSIFNKIIHNFMSGIFYKLNVWKKNLIKTFIAQQIAFFINVMSQACVNLRPEVKYNELLPLFRNQEYALKFFYNFLASFIIATLIQYTKSSGNRFYAKLIRYFYNYKTGEGISGLNDKKAREKFIHVIVHRKWDALLRPDTLQTFFYIYKNDPENDLINQILTKVHYAFIKKCSLWTCATFFGWSPLSPLISIFLVLYKTTVSRLTQTKQALKSTTDPIYQDNEKKADNDISGETSSLYCIATQDLQTSYHPNRESKSEEKYKIIGNEWVQIILEISIKILAMVVGVFYPKNYLFISCVSEYGYPLLFNNISLDLVSYLVGFFKNFRIFFNPGKYFLFLITSIIYIKCMTVEALSMWEIVCCCNLHFNGPRSLLILGGMYSILNFDNKVKSILLGLFISLGYFSNFDVKHLISLILFSHIILNTLLYFQSDFLEDFRIRINPAFKKSPDQVLINTDTLKIYESYYPTSTKFIPNKPVKSNHNNETLGSVGHIKEFNKKDIKENYVPEINFNPRENFSQPNSVSFGVHSDDLSRSYYIKKTKNLPNRLFESLGTK